MGFFFDLTIDNYYTDISRSTGFRSDIVKRNHVSVPKPESYLRLDFFRIVTIPWVWSDTPRVPSIRVGRNETPRELPTRDGITISKYEESGLILIIPDDGLSNQEALERFFHSVQGWKVEDRKGLLKDVPIIFNINEEESLRPRAINVALSKKRRPDLMACFLGVSCGVTFE